MCCVVFPLPIGSSNKDKQSKVLRIIIINLQISNIPDITRCFIDTLSLTHNIIDTQESDWFYMGFLSLICMSSGVSICSLRCVNISFYSMNILGSTYVLEY